MSDKALISQRNRNKFLTEHSKVGKMKNTLKKGLLFMILLVFVSQIACLDSNEGKKKEKVETRPVLKLEKDTTIRHLNGFPVLVPIDESYKKTDLQKRIKQIKNAVDEKNVDNLLNYISDDIRITFDNIENQPDFKTFWKLSEQPEISDIWQILDDVLQLSGTFYQKNEFFIPYTFSHFPAEYNPFEFGVITKENTIMKAEPNESSIEIGELTYEIVRIISQKNSSNTKNQEKIDAWMKIKRQNEEVGYVLKEYISRPTDYRLGLQEQDGEWKIHFLLHGK
jgi:hypothetical protein